jgi:LPS-assembly lipoprotein
MGRGAGHTRRSLLLGGAQGALGLMLAGCGFRPMYGPAATDAGLSVDMRRELAAIRTDYLGERAGVLLRRALDRRFESAAGGERVPVKYTLQLNITYGVEPLAYRRDGQITRIRYIGTSNWTLLTRASPPVELSRGQVRTMDAFNVPDFQFYSAEVSRDAMEGRLLDEFVEQIFLDVTAKLRGRLRTAQR